MKAKDLLTIAKKWNQVFDNVRNKSDVSQRDLVALLWMNQRFIIILKAENFLNKDQTEFANAPEVSDASPLNVYMLHINNVLSYYPSESSANDINHWASATPFQAYNFRERFREQLLALILLVLLCRDLLLLWTHKVALAALLTVSHLSIFILPVVILASWSVYDKLFNFRFDSHSFNLAYIPSRLKREPLLSVTEGILSVGFFEKPGNRELVEAINEEYHRVNLQSLNSVN